MTLTTLVSLLGQEYTMQSRRPLTLFEKRRNSRGSEMGTEGYQHFYPRRSSMPSVAKSFGSYGVTTPYPATAPATPLGHADQQPIPVYDDTSPHAALSRSVATPQPRSRGPERKQRSKSRVNAPTIDPLLLAKLPPKAASAPPTMYAQPCGMGYPYDHSQAGPSTSSAFDYYPPVYTVQQVRAIGREQGRQLAEAAKADNRPVSDYLATYPYAPPPASPIQNPFSSIGIKRKRDLPDIHYPLPIIIQQPTYTQSCPSALPRLNSPLTAPIQPSLVKLPSIQEVLAHGSESPRVESPLTPPPPSPVRVRDVKPSRQKKTFIECPLCHGMFKPRAGTINWHLAKHDDRTCVYCQQYFIRAVLLRGHLETCEERVKVKDELDV